MGLSARMIKDRTEIAPIQGEVCDEADTMTMGFIKKKKAGILAGTAWVLYACLLALAADKPNLLLVTIDTLRPDRLSCYGSPYVKTPNIDAVAGRVLK